MDPSLNCFIEQLNSSYNTSSVRDAIETLLKIHRNIYFNKNDVKYKKLQLHNQTFCKKVWNVAPAQSFMLHCGWRQVGDSLYFDNDQHLLTIINTLLEHRFVQPKNSEWKTEAKIENLYTSKQHEEKLRAKAAEKRRKELEEFEKDKMYRKHLAQSVKQQIAEDRARVRQLRYTPPVVRRQIPAGRTHNRQLPYTQPMVRRQIPPGRTHNRQLPYTQPMVRRQIPPGRTHNRQLPYTQPMGRRLLN